MLNTFNNFVRFFQDILHLLSLGIAFFPLFDSLLEIIPTPYGMEKPTRVLSTIACSLVILIGFTKAQDIIALTPIINSQDRSNLLIISACIGAIGLFLFTKLFKNGHQQNMMFTYILAFTFMTTSFTILGTTLYIDNNASNCQPGLRKTYKNHRQRIYYCDNQLGDNRLYKLLEESIELKDTDYDISKGDEKRFGYIHRRYINLSTNVVKIKRLRNTHFTDIEFISEIFIPRDHRTYYDSDGYALSLEDFNWISENQFSIYIKNTRFEDFDSIFSSPNGRLVTIANQGISCGYIPLSKRYLISLDNLLQVIECKPI